MTTYRGIITMTIHVAQESAGGEILPKPLSIEESSLFDIPRGINIEIQGNDYLECMRNLKKETERIQGLYNESR